MNSIKGFDMLAHLKELSLHSTPVSSLLRLTVDQAFRVLADHEARHLGQAERALASAEDAASEG